MSFANLEERCIRSSKHCLVRVSASTRHSGIYCDGKEKKKKKFGKTKPMRLITSLWVSVHVTRTCVICARGKLPFLDFLA